MQTDIQTLRGPVTSVLVDDGRNVWILTLPIRFDAVKSLRFPYFSRFPHKRLADDIPNNDVELTCRSQNLRVLDITFVDEELVSGFNNGYVS